MDITRTNDVHTHIFTLKNQEFTGNLKISLPKKNHIINSIPKNLKYDQKKKEKRKTSKH